MFLEMWFNDENLYGLIICRSRVEREEESVLFQSVFMDSLSEMVMFLEAQGFAVEICMEWRTIYTCFPVSDDLKWDYKQDWGQQIKKVNWENNR